MSCLLMVSPSSIFGDSVESSPQARSCEEGVRDLFPRDSGTGILNHFLPSSGQRPETRLTLTPNSFTLERTSEPVWTGSLGLPRPPHAALCTSCHQTPQPSRALPGQHSPSACLPPEKPSLSGLRALGERISQDLGR